MIFYAQLNEDDFVIGLSQLSGKVIKEGLIEITEEQFEAMSQGLYKYENGTFVRLPEPEIEPATTLDEKIDLLGQMMVELYLKDGEA